MVQICLYCLKCTTFGQSILKKITKIVANKCTILSQNALNSISAEARGAYSAPTDA